MFVVQRPSPLSLYMQLIWSVLGQRWGQVWSTCCFLKWVKKPAFLYKISLYWVLVLISYASLHVAIYSLIINCYVAMSMTFTYYLKIKCWSMVRSPPYSLNAPPWTCVSQNCVLLQKWLGAQSFAVSCFHSNLWIFNVLCGSVLFFVAVVTWIVMPV